MLQNTSLGREHFDDDPDLLPVFDDIAQLVFIAKEIRKQAKPFRERGLKNRETIERARNMISKLQEVVEQLIPLQFMTANDKRRKLWRAVRRKNLALLSAVSDDAETLAVIEAETYEGTGAVGNVFRVQVKYRLDMLRQSWTHV